MYPFVHLSALQHHHRFTTREVKIGNLPMGGQQPIRIQSMTSTPTMDTEATVAQCIRMIEAGSEYVRITAPGVKEAQQLGHIRELLHQRGYFNPLIADIHFNPKAAEIAAALVEKVRINPGNYVDKYPKDKIDFTDAEHLEGVAKIRKNIAPLIHICKTHGTALRIGSNHGSLSQRIMSRYGDSPEGMVEAALEFVRICRDMDFHQLVLSMKSSNTRVMIEANRLLVKRMQEENMDYPIHLGVTEAGEGEDGRIKSAVGIGALLEEGIGDTLRVSLTEEPEYELPVAQSLARHYQQPDNTPVYLPCENTKRQQPTYNTVGRIGPGLPPVVLARPIIDPHQPESTLNTLGFSRKAPHNHWIPGDQSPDFLVSDQPLSLENSPGLFRIGKGALHLYTANEIDTLPQASENPRFLKLATNEITATSCQKISGHQNLVLMLSSTHPAYSMDMRCSLEFLQMHGVHHPVILDYYSLEKDHSDLMVQSARQVGSLFTDELIHGIALYAKDDIPAADTNQIAFGILQAARARITKTEYISCPSCGRTQYNIQEAVTKIRKRTSHLKGLKIGIMGCIVNGPGEMADADYGYVGAGPGKITLYKGKTVARKQIPESHAVEELIGLIKAAGDWQEPA